MPQEPGSGPRKWWKGLPPWIQVGIGIATLVVGGGAGIAINNYSSSGPSNSASPSSPAQPTSAASPPASTSVFYSGPAGIPETGADFDYNPPMSASGNVPATSLGLKSFSSNMLLSQHLGSSSQPSEQECRARVKSHQPYDTGPNAGARGQVLSPHSAGPYRSSRHHASEIPTKPHSWPSDGLELSITAAWWSAHVCPLAEAAQLQWLES